MQKMLSANQIVGFSSFIVLKTIGVIKVDFHADTYLLRLQIADVNLGRCGQRCPIQLQLV